ncbi:IclR family transcriptional regulator [Paracandidimonas soli]|uniref:IclR family transcriptional regulator n=1 Tax=Paracandidimonas soli TaxID=1917182 RepID=UPI00333F1D26
MAVKGKSAAAMERPGAPALEKGLDLLEALAEESDGLSQKALADKIGRSVSEIFRMLSVLEQRGYVVRDADTGQYALSLRLFELVNQHPPMRRLQRAALQAMEALVAEIGHSCHLVAMNSGRFTVVSQSEPDRLMGWTVKLGGNVALSSHYASARVMSAFQLPERRAEMASQMARQDGIGDASALLERLQRISEDGYEIAPSDAAYGVVDVSVPILNQFGVAVAALTVPAMTQPGVDLMKDVALREKILEATQRAAKQISCAVGNVG